MLFLLSNDPLHPFLKIPVNIDIQPRYRTFMPDGDQIVVETDEATKAIYLIPQGKPLTVTSTVLDGIPGEADFSAWSGRLPNQTADVQGYKITVRVPENIPDGAHYVNLKIATDEPGLKSVSIPLLVQRGIACTPERIIWGTLTFPVDSQVELSNPKRAFKILKIRTSNPHFKARVTDSGLAKTHRLKVHYDGAGAAGPVSGWVFVTTNDPHRPTVKLPFEGQVQ